MSDRTTSALCTFKCPDCSENFVAWISFTRHYKTKHQRTAFQKDVIIYLTKTTVHKCRICSEMVLCDSQFLSKHLSKHNTTISEYGRQYDCSDNWRSKNVKMFKERGSVTTKVIGNLCIYKCPKCEKTFKSLGNLKAHGAATPKCPLINFKYVMNYITKIVTYNCIKCSKVLLYDELVLRQHAFKAHKIKTLNEYARQVGVAIQANARVERNNTFERVTKDAELVIETGNFCRYACKLCPYSCRTWSTLQIHLKEKDHWCSSGRDWSIYITKVVLHQCMVCRKKLLNDSTFLCGHILQCHQQTMPEYRKKFGL